MNNIANIRISSREVIDDIRSAAWLESETNPDADIHSRHEMADICEKDNIERVWRILGICVAEIRMALRAILIPDPQEWLRNDLERPEHWDFIFQNRLPPHTANFLKEKIHEYLVARVISDRLAVLIPDAADFWLSSASDILSTISSTSNSATTLRPVRRPLWPL